VNGGWLRKGEKKSQSPDFSVSYSYPYSNSHPFPHALALSSPYSNSSRRDFTAEAQRGKRGMSRKRI